MRRGSMPDSFQISVATTSQGFAIVIQMPWNPASAIVLMNVFAVSVVKKSSPSRSLDDSETSPAQFTITSHCASCA